MMQACMNCNPGLSGTTANLSPKSRNAPHYFHLHSSEATAQLGNHHTTLSAFEVAMEGWLMRGCISLAGVETIGADMSHFFTL